MQISNEEIDYNRYVMWIADCIKNGDQQKDCSYFVQGQAKAVKVANHLRNVGYIVSTLDYGEWIKIVVHRY